MAEFECEFRFGQGVPLQEAEDSVRLALLAAVGLYGEERVKHDVEYMITPLKAMITISGTVPVAESVADMTEAFLTNEFGAEAFTVTRAGEREAAGTT